MCRDGVEEVRQGNEVSRSLLTSRAKLGSATCQGVVVVVVHVVETDRVRLGWRVRSKLWDVNAN
jgi:hypothetical protein